jgi:hypothetical protein
MARTSAAAQATQSASVRNCEKPSTRSAVINAALPMVSATSNAGAIHVRVLAIRVLPKTDHFESAFPSRNARRHGRTGTPKRRRGCSYREDNDPIAGNLVASTTFAYGPRPTRPSAEAVHFD